VCSTIGCCRRDLSPADACVTTNGDPNAWPREVQVPVSHLPTVSKALSPPDLPCLSLTLCFSPEASVSRRICGVDVREDAHIGRKGAS
jgi:hypothetical protein